MDPEITEHSLLYKGIIDNETHRLKNEKAINIKKVLPFMESENLQFHLMDLPCILLVICLEVKEELIYTW